MQYQRHTLKPGLQYDTSFGVEGPMGVPDVLRQGKRDAKSTLGPRHELEQIVSQDAHDNTRLAMWADIGGRHTMMRIRTERALVAMPSRQHLPCLVRSNVALETLRGTDETIDFCDFLNDPRDAEEMGDPHSMMEYRLGM